MSNKLRRYRIGKPGGSTTYIHPHYDLGTLSQGLGAYRKAVWHYKKEIKLTGYYKAHYNLGVILQERKRYRDAIGEFRKALRRNPRLHEAYNNLGYCYFHLGNCEDAVSAYSKAVNLRRRDPTYLTNLGRAYARAGRYQEAVATMRRAMVLAPDHLATRTVLGYLLLERKETLSEGIRLLRAANRSNPSDPQVLASLASGYLNLGRLQEAAELLRKAKGLAPKDAFVLEEVRRSHRRGRTLAGAKAQRVLPE